MTYTPLPSIAWENVAFTPVTGTTYLKPTLLHGEPVQAELGAAGLNQHNGIYQISIMAPANTGAGGILTLQNGLVDHFKRGTVLTYGGINVRISKAWPGQWQTETDRVHVPVTIQFFSYAAP